jgi:LPXTG-site transpeptidase (sortase) family protein
MDFFLYPFKQIGKHWLSFAIVFFFVFSGSYIIADEVRDSLPREEALKAPTQVVVPAQVAVRDTPVRIEIPVLNIDTVIANPSSTDVAVLDEHLLKGAVRYPGSALLGEQGNVLIFGHSSYLPVVRNQAFKAFNEIQNLKKDDEIRVYSDTRVFIYGVEEVHKVSAKSTEEIVLESKNNLLTLVTCNTFGAKSDRFLLKATLRTVEKL